MQGQSPVAVVVGSDASEQGQREQFMQIGTKSKAHTDDIMLMYKNMLTYQHIMFRSRKSRVCSVLGVEYIREAELRH